MEKALRWSNLILIFLTLLCYVSPFVNPAAFSWFSFLGMAYPWLLLLNVLFILLWLVRKEWYFLFSLGCILIGFNHFKSFVGLEQALPMVEKEWTVLTMNSMGYQKLKGQVRKEFDQLMAEHQPDIVLLQEGYHGGWPLDKKIYPHRYQPKDKMLSIHAKRPLSAKGQFDFGNKSNGCIYADVQLDGQTVRVYNYHLQSNRVTGDASKLQREGDLKKRETWVGIRGMLGKVKRAATVRSEQVKEIIAHAKKATHPVILAGDMNDTPLSYTYHCLSQEFVDGFKLRAAGTGTTYDGAIPLLRIDYIWTDPRLKVRSHDIIKKSFSDHHPVVSRLSLEK